MPGRTSSARPSTSPTDSGNPGTPTTWTRARTRGRPSRSCSVKTDFAGHNVLAWVGIDSAGTADNGYIISVNGRPLPAVLGIVPSGGKVTAFAI